MIRRRAKPDGLPCRVYERRGVRDYSIGYKSEDGTWTFRLKCPVTDKAKIAELRREAITRAAQQKQGKPRENTVSALMDAWMKRQEALPLNSESRRAESTLRENKREIEQLRKAFGPMPVDSIEKGDAYAYLDACLVAVDKKGNPRPRPAKGNKEIGLLRTILEYGVRVGMIKANPFDGVEKLVTSQEQRLVTDAELTLAAEVGRELGGPPLIVALALKTAWLCVRRSVEVRALSVGQITDAGIVWAAAKRKRGTAQLEGLIEWSPELRATVDEALAVPRYKDAGEWFVFGNLSGDRYTKGGWKATLSKLMAACVAEAEKRGEAFRPFSLQDCRPKGVTDKLEQGDGDVMDATMHTNERMIKATYDRRRRRVAKPVR